MPTLDKDGEVFVLHLDPDDENRLSLGRLAAVEAALDEVEAARAPKALVTVNTGKFWCTGLDLDHLEAHPEEHANYIDRVHALYARTLASETVTVAALGGHTFAGGALWALAHDVRVMRSDRGWFCLPEVDIDKAFEPGMTALLFARLPPQVAHEAMTTGRRYGGDVAASLGIVDATATAEDLVEVATTRARDLAAKSKPVRGEIKRIAYAATLASLRTPTPR